MIQIATVGDAQVVVKEGLRKVPSEKLYILHTENERSESKLNQDLKKARSKDEKNRIQTQQYQTNAEKLKIEILNEFDVKVELQKVGKFDTYAVIREIQEIIRKEKKKNKKLQGEDFAINITGGTKAMVAGSVCSAYLAQTRMYYVLQYHEAKKGGELVIELPVPSRIKRMNTLSGSNENTTAMILREIWKLGSPTTLEKLKDVTKKIKFETKKQKFKKQSKNKSVEIESKSIQKKITAQILNYHLNKLDSKFLTRNKAKDVDRKIIKKAYDITDDKEVEKISRNGKNVIIQLTETGHLYAAYPETIGDVI